MKYVWLVCTLLIITTACNDVAYGSKEDFNMLEIIKTRRSIRSFDQQREVDRATVELILEAGIYAPSAGNGQPWKYYVISDQELKQNLVNAALRQKFIAQAPWLIVVCIDKAQAESRYGERGLNLYSIQDTAAATQNMLLMAHSLGLATCWIGAFSEQQVIEVLGLKENLRPVVIIPLGYPAQSPPAPARKPLETVVEWK